MKLVSFQVFSFRNIVDSGNIRVDPSVTCLVGKNEAGKSALLEALYLFNPAYNESFNVEEQYPRWLLAEHRRSGGLQEQAPIRVTFSLSREDIRAVSSAVGEGVLTSDQVTITRKYGGEALWKFDWSEPTAINNLVAEFPVKVRHLLTNTDTLDGVRAVLSEATPGDDGPSPEELGEAAATIRQRGFEGIGVRQRILDVLRGQLPRFFRFTAYSTLPGRIDFRELAKAPEEGPALSSLQTARALLALAGTDIEQLGNDDYELRRSELEAVQIDLTRQVFDYWKQNPHLEVFIDVDKETVTRPNNATAVSRFLDIRLRDARTGYSNNFSQRSSGFQWFFSFLAAFSEFENKTATIVLLDEPALTLHGRAQADFLRFINERLAPSSPVIYTTHSPFMVEAGRLKRVRVVEDNGPPRGATASSDVLGADPDSLFPLQAALGYDIAQNLFVGPHNLVVEGTSDYIYLTELSRVCRAAGREGLDERWRILPAGGGTNIPTFVSLVGPHLDVTVLADSDTQGMQRVTNMVSRRLLAGHRLIMVDVATDSNHADIEDLFSEGDYLDLYNRTYGTSLRVDELPSGERIVKRIEAHIGKSFDHGEVAETLLRSREELSFTDISLGRFAKLLAAVNATIQS